MDELAWLFYLRAEIPSGAGTLFVWNRQKSGWRRVAEGIPLPPPAQRNVRVDSKDGLAVYSAGVRDGYAVYLYDAGVDRAMDLARIEKRDAANLRLGFRRVNGMIPG